MKKTGITRKDGNDPFARLHGTNGNDQFDGDSKNNNFDGRGGHDLIVGHAGDDELSGGGGNDTIYGGWGNDVISGGSGNDRLWGGMYTDTIKGGGGADMFLFTAWRDIDGFTGSGFDKILDFDPNEPGERISIQTAFYQEIETFAALKAIMVQDGNDVVMSFDHDLATLVLKDVKIEQLRADDFDIYLG